MPEQRHFLAFYEGNDDRAVLKELKGAALLPDYCEIAERKEDQFKGRDGSVKQLASFARPGDGAGGSSVVLLDLDDWDVDQLTTWFSKQLDNELRSGKSPIMIRSEASKSPRVRLLVLSDGQRESRCAMVAVGLADDSGLRSSWGLQKFAIDDYLFLMAADPAVVTANRDFQVVAHEKTIRKLHEIVSLLRTNDIAVQQSKRLLHLLRAIIGFRASSATFIERLISKGLESAGIQRIRELFHPLLEDFAESTSLLEL